MKAVILTILFLFLSANQIFAQNQTVRGRVLDAQIDEPLIGASVILLNFDPIKGAVTDVDGYFSIDDVPVGRQSLTVQYIGYKSTTLPNVLVTAGKQAILDIKLEESVEQMAEIVVTAASSKDEPINELAKVSARTFSLEEVTRFSGGRNDVARLASNFAGVSTADDSRNDIVIRGNSPTGLLWQVEGIPVANTNHFATLGTTGGPVNALNTNLLRTSDFITGAFPAEYGNALSGVFDVKFRNGNTDELEFTGQMGFNGLELMVEAPINKENHSSFVASYRYGVASLAATGTSAIPYYQDFNFKVNLGKSKLGRIEIFGMGGISSIDFLGDEISEDDLFTNPDNDAYVKNALGIVGISQNLRINKTTYLKTILGVSTNQSFYDQDNLIKDVQGNRINKYKAIEIEDSNNRYSLSSALTKKFSSKFSLKTGFVGQIIDLNSLARDRDNRVGIPDTNQDGIPDTFITSRDENNSFSLLQFYSQAAYKFTDKVSLTAGLHSQYLELSGDFVVEPRAALSWQLNYKHKLSFAYGNHAQMANLPTLLYREQTDSLVFEATNKKLEFSRANHFVVAYDVKIADNWRLKLETYYQDLYNIPIEKQSSSYSILNEGSGFVFDNRGSLVNEGTGKNYGVEITLERFFSKGYYALLTSSIFDSKYTGSDGIERNTGFNNQYVVNGLLGKEWKVGASKRNAITFDTKLATSGGKYYTPIDLEATRLNKGRQVLQNDKAFSERYSSYFRWDVKFGFRLNSKNKKISQQWYVDLQNVSNRENVFVKRYNPLTDKIDIVKQLGFFPDILYRIQF